MISHLLHSKGRLQCSWFFLALAFDDFSDFRSLIFTCKMKWLGYWRSEGFKQSLMHCVLAPEKCFTLTLHCRNLFDISQPLVCLTMLSPNMATDFSFFLSFFFQFDALLSFHCCVAPCYYYCILWCCCDLLQQYHYLFHLLHWRVFC